MRLGISDATIELYQPNRLSWESAYCHSLVEIPPTICVIISHLQSSVYFLLVCFSVVIIQLVMVSSILNTASEFNRLLHGARIKAPPHIIPILAYSMITVILLLLLEMFFLLYFASS